MSLGGHPAVTLAESRDKASPARKLFADGLDPLAQRDQASASSQRNPCARRKWLHRASNGRGGGKHVYGRPQDIPRTNAAVSGYS